MKTRNFTWELIGALSGIASVALFVGAGIFGGDADLDPSNSARDLALEIKAEADDILLSSLFSLFSALSFLWFLGYLRRIFREAEGEGEWLTSVAFGGGLVVVAVLLGFNALSFAMDDSTDPQVAKVLAALQWNYSWLFAPPIIAFTAASSAVIIRFRALPRWVGWIGVLVALSALLPWIGFITVQVWLLIASVVLVVRVVKNQNASNSA